MLFYPVFRVIFISCLSCFLVQDTDLPKDHWTFQWKGLNLYSRVWVLKIATFEGSRVEILRALQF